MKNLCSLLLTFLLLGLVPKLHAVTFKIGVLAPEGTTWAKNLKSMSEEVEKTTKGKVKFKIYYGGVHGDEPDVLKKIRVKQLHGGIFTGRTLGEINGDVRIVEVPFNFSGDRQKSWKATEALEPFFNKGFSKEGFEGLGFFEIGNVFLVTTKKATSFDELRKLKMWTWSGDVLAETLVTQMKLVSVPLGLPDVLSSLSTGIIEGAYSSAMGIIALQWNTKINYLISDPITFAIGAFLIDKDRWAKVPAEYQQMVKEIVKSHITKANGMMVKENEEAMEILTSMGVESIPFKATSADEKKQIRENIMQVLTGKVFSKQTVEKFEKVASGL